MVETCIFPVLMYGSENWCLTDQCITILDSFIGELSKRLLKFPQWFSNTPATIICGLRSARCMCLCRKLSFLHKIISDDGKCPISSEVFKALCDDSASLCLVKECKHLEVAYDTHFTSMLLDPELSESFHLRHMKKRIQSEDRDLQLQMHNGRSDMQHIVEIERTIGWPRLWDMALGHGQQCIDGLRHLARVLAYPTHAVKPCPLCDLEDLRGITLLNHVLNQHSSLSQTEEELLSCLLSVMDTDSPFFVKVCSLSRLF